jgi:hypothetical protein
MPLDPKISTAVGNCLAACLASESPLARLPASLHALARDDTWTPDEIKEIEAKARPILEQLARGN